MASKSRELIKRIQHELARRGFDPGTIDGLDGSRTRGAIRRFQASAGLLADGIVGPKTFAALFGASAVAPAAADDPGMPWFQEARRLIGVREKVGPGSNPTIIDWSKDVKISYPSDDIPWCGLFVSHCVSSTLSDEALPADP